MMALKYFFSLLVVFVGLSTRDCLKISVYYESLCPDSISFIKDQLYPTYLKLGSLIDVDLVPYGKAIQNKVDDKWQFECQHGPSECKGNKIQACALNQEYDFSKKMAYINCLMRAYNPSKYGRQCASKVGVNWADINTCTNSDVGDNLLAEYGDRTHSVEPQISFVPTIILDDVYNRNDQSQALSDLLKLVCDKLKNPPECSN